MKSRSRANRIYRAGTEGAGFSEKEKRFLAAVAIMIDAATKSPSRKKAEKRVSRPALPFTPEQLYDRVRATEKVACEPYDRGWFGRLGTKLHALSGQLEAKDMDTLCEWLESGGIDWMSETPSFGVLIKNLPDWLARARANDRGSCEGPSAEEAFGMGVGNG